MTMLTIADSHRGGGSGPPPLNKLIKRVQHTSPSIVINYGLRSRKLCGLGERSSVIVLKIKLILDSVAIDIHVQLESIYKC